jgi:hypothetical protein
MMQRILHARASRLLIAGARQRSFSRGSCPQRRPVDLRALAGLRFDAPTLPIALGRLGGMRYLSAQPGTWIDPKARPKGEHLKLYARNLTDEAKEGKLDPGENPLLSPDGSWILKSIPFVPPAVIGRDEVIFRVTQVLARRTKNNPVLIGEPGVGKTAIAEGLAR